MEEKKREVISDSTETEKNTETKIGKKMKKGTKALIIVAVVALLIPAVLAGAVFVMVAVGKSHMSPAIIDIQTVETSKEEIETSDDGKVVTYKGKKYRYNENIVPIAFMGIDTKELGTNQSVSGGVGQSDTNMVMAFDTSNGNLSMIVIPRDSMVDMKIFDSSGNQTGVETLQLCLSYAYGDGREKSCENTLECIEHILCGIEIDSYISLDTSGIGELNDAVGGVEVVCLETVADFTEGQKILLKGEFARNYVQRRDTSKFNSDELRRARQLQYAKGFASKALSAAKKDFTVITKLFKVAEKYSCTNLDLSTVTYLASSVVSRGEINFDNIYVLEGEAVMGESFVEVHLDEAKTLETVLDVFYTEIS